MKKLMTAIFSLFVIFFTAACGNNNPAVPAGPNATIIPTATNSASVSRTATATVTATSSPTGTRTVTRTITSTRTITQTATITQTSTPITMTFISVDDAYVSGGAPNVNASYGNCPEIGMSINASDPQEGLIKIDVSPLAGKTIVRAIIRLKPTITSGTTVYITSDLAGSSWLEKNALVCPDTGGTAVTWNTKPPKGGLGSILSPTSVYINGAMGVTGFEIQSPVISIWADNPAQNKGFYLLIDGAQSTVDSSAFFNSSESSSDGPIMDVYYYP